MSYLNDRVLAHLKSVADLPDLTGTRYELIREAGRGGMGAVYVVFDRELQREAALKVVDRGSGIEAQVTASLEHPGIVPVHDGGILPDGRNFYVMRYVDGASLDPQNTAEIDRLRIFQKICDTVAYAHNQQVIHRDLKPENIIIGNFGEVFIVDWGVALSPKSQQEPRGMVVGTPMFMAPEQGAGQQATPAADIYSLGAILKWMFPTNLAAPLQSIASKAMATNPSDRYATVADLNRDISRYVVREPVTAHRETALESTIRWAGRNRTLLLLMAAYLIVKFAVYFLRFL
ncbi:hypothetical protein F183_A34690 [Bryobacterales bacterium F-183]|nr:hypothetical protein F183_A34690 [Bryobacterales bacterium F-183]